MMDGRRSTHRKRSPWAAWYGEDYRDGVAELSDAACGVYSKLISYQISHGSFPHPDTHFEQACKVALTTPESLQKVWPEIACKFRKRSDGRLENPRMAEEIRVRNGIREARMDAAAKSHANRSAKPRANVPAKASVLHDAKDHCLHDASPSPSPSPILEVSNATHSQGSKLPGPAENGFARFWEAYGHKVDKADASKAWAKAIKRADPETILREAQWHAANRGPVPHAATWLNGSRWEDSHEAVLAEAKRFSGAKPTPPRYVPDKKPQDFSLESTRAKAERERAEAQKAREKAEKLNQEFIANAQKMAGDGAVNGLVEALNRAVKR